MRAATVVATAAAVVGLAAACGGSSSSSSHRSVTTWAQALPGLRAGFDRTSANPCERGDLRCLDLLLAEMRRRDAALSASCDHRALFTRMYLRTTEALRAGVSAGRFHDPAWIIHFAAWFALLDFRAESAWQHGQRAGVPGAWDVTYAAAARRSVRSIGDLLLGINAHISRDLAFVVAANARRGTTAVDPDFALFTDVIESKSKAVIAELAQRFDQALLVEEVPLALGGQRTLGQLVGVWRTEAWRNGIALRDARGPERVAVEQRIERVSRLRADAIVAATAYLPIVQSSRSRDAYCASHRAAPQQSVDLVKACDVLSRCSDLVARWTKAEGLRGRAVIGAKAFYVNACLSCHTYLGDGTRRLRAPDLTAEARRHRGVEWQIKLLRCPSCVFAGVQMPPLPFIHVRDVAVFLESSNGQVRTG